MRYPSKTCTLPTNQRQLIVSPLYGNMKSSSSACTHIRRDNGPVVKVQRHRSRSRTVCLDADGTVNQVRVQQNTQHFAQESNGKAPQDEGAQTSSNGRSCSMSLPGTGFHTPTEMFVNATAPHSPCAERRVGTSGEGRYVRTNNDDKTYSHGNSHTDGARESQNTMNRIVTDGEQRTSPFRTSSAQQVPTRTRASTDVHVQGRPHHTSSERAPSGAISYRNGRHGSMGGYDADGMSMALDTLTDAMDCRDEALSLAMATPEEQEAQFRMQSYVSDGGQMSAHKRSMAPPGASVRSSAGLDLDTHMSMSTGDGGTVPQFIIGGDAVSAHTIQPQTHPSFVFETMQRTSSHTRTQTPTEARAYTSAPHDLQTSAPNTSDTNTFARPYAYNYDGRANPHTPIEPDSCSTSTPALFSLGDSDEVTLSYGSQIIDSGVFLNRFDVGVNGTGYHGNAELPLERPVRPFVASVQTARKSTAPRIPNWNEASASEIGGEVGIAYEFAYAPTSATASIFTEAQPHTATQDHARAYTASRSGTVWLGGQSDNTATKIARLESNDRECSTPGRTQSNEFVHAHKRAHTRAYPNSQASCPNLASIDGTPGYLSSVEARRRMRGSVSIPNTVAPNTPNEPHFLPSQTVPPMSLYDPPRAAPEPMPVVAHEPHETSLQGNTTQPTQTHARTQLRKDIHTQRHISKAHTHTEMHSHRRARERSSYSISGDTTVVRARRKRSASVSERESLIMQASTQAHVDSQTRTHSQMHTHNHNHNHNHTRPQGQSQGHPHVPTVVRLGLNGPAPTEPASRSAAHYRSRGETQLAERRIGTHAHAHGHSSVHLNQATTTTPAGSFGASVPMSLPNVSTMEALAQAGSLRSTRMSVDMGEIKGGLRSSRLSVDMGGIESQGRICVARLDTAPGRYEPRTTSNSDISDALAAVDNAAVDDSTVGTRKAAAGIQSTAGRPADTPTKPANGGVGMVNGLSGSGMETHLRVQPTASDTLDVQANRSSPLASLSADLLVGQVARMSVNNTNAVDDETEDADGCGGTSTSASPILRGRCKAEGGHAMPGYGSVDSDVHTRATNTHGANELRRNVSADSNPVGQMYVEAFAIAQSYLSDRQIAVHERSDNGPMHTHRPSDGPSALFGLASSLHAPPPNTQRQPQPQVQPHTPTHQPLGGRQRLAQEQAQAQAQAQHNYSQGFTDPLDRDVHKPPMAHSRANLAPADCQEPVLSNMFEAVDKLDTLDTLNNAHAYTDDAKLQDAKILRPVIGQRSRKESFCDTVVSALTLSRALSMATEGTNTIEMTDSVQRSTLTVPYTTEPSTATGVPAELRNRPYPDMCGTAPRRDIYTNTHRRDGGNEATTMHASQATVDNGTQSVRVHRSGGDAHADADEGSGVREVAESKSSVYYSPENTGLHIGMSQSHTSMHTHTHTSTVQGPRRAHTHTPTHKKSEHTSASGRASANVTQLPSETPIHTHTDTPAHAATHAHAQSPTDALPPAGAHTDALLYANADEGVALAVPDVVLVGSRYSGMADFDVIDQIGSGQFADVYLAIDKITMNKIALKMSKKRRHKDAQRMVEEVTLQMTLQDHPYIALAYGAFTAPCGRPTSVQEYIPGGDLLQRIPANGFPEMKCLRLFIQLADAVQHIHDLNIVHRDIKNDNIVVDGNGNLRLIDFGFATRVDEAERVDYYVGTTQYMSPEILLYEERHKTKKEMMYPCAVPRRTVATSDLDLMACDVWSAGVVMFTMLTGRFPWKRAASKNERYDAYAKGKIKQTSRTWQSFSWDVQTLLEKMLCTDPERRWPARAVLSYISGLV